MKEEEVLSFLKKDFKRKRERDLKKKECNLTHKLKLDRSTDAAARGRKRESSRLGAEGRRVGRERERSKKEREKKKTQSPSLFTSLFTLFSRKPLCFCGGSSFRTLAREPTRVAMPASVAAAAARASARRLRRAGSSTSSMAFAAIAITMALISRASAFYLPGVAPQDFAMVSLCCSRSLSFERGPGSQGRGWEKKGKKKNEEERKGEKEPHRFFLFRRALLRPLFPLSLLPSHRLPQLSSNTNSTTTTHQKRATPSL